MSEHGETPEEMAQAITWQMRSIVKISLETFRKRYGQPTPALLEKLRVALMNDTRERVDQFFGETIKGSDAG